MHRHPTSKRPQKVPHPTFTPHDNSPILDPIRKTPPQRRPALEFPVPSLHPQTLESSSQKQVSKGEIGAPSTIPHLLHCPFRTLQTRIAMSMTT